MRVFKFASLRKNRKARINQTREQMIKSLRKRGFTEAYLSAKTDLQLAQMMNRFTGSGGGYTPSTFKFTGMR